MQNGWQLMLRKNLQIFSSKISSPEIHSDAIQKEYKGNKDSTAKQCFLGFFFFFKESIVNVH